MPSLTFETDAQQLRQLHIHGVTEVQASISTLCFNIDPRNETAKNEIN